MASVTGETNVEPELSYEDEQIQMLIQKHLDQERAEVEKERKRQEANSHREFVKRQDEEYQASVLKDLEKMDTDKKDPVFEEPSMEEMRRVRLMRFKG